MVDDVLENLFQTVIHGQPGEARSLIVGLFALGCFRHGSFSEFHADAHEKSGLRDIVS
jgi:hypothetical protein